MFMQACINLKKCRNHTEIQMPKKWLLRCSFLTQKSTDRVHRVTEYTLNIISFVNFLTEAHKWNLYKYHSLYIQPCMGMIAPLAKDAFSPPIKRACVFFLFILLSISLFLPPLQWPGHHAHPLLRWRRQRSDFDSMSYLIRRVSRFTALHSLSLSLFYTQGSPSPSGMKTKTKGVCPAPFIILRLESQRSTSDRIGIKRCPKLHQTNRTAQTSLKST